MSGETTMNQFDAKAGLLILPDSIIARQFDAVRKKWPAAMLTAYPNGQFALSVPGCRLLNPDQWNKPTVALAAILPAGYPLAAPDLFFYDQEFAKAHGGIPRNQTHDWRQPFGFTRFINSMTKWNPNKDTLVTVVNFMRVGLSALARDLS